MMFTEFFIIVLILFQVNCEKKCDSPTMHLEDEYGKLLNTYNNNQNSSELDIYHVEVSEDIYDACRFIWDKSGISFNIVCMSNCPIKVTTDTFQEFFGGYTREIVNSTDIFKFVGTIRSCNRYNGLYTCNIVGSDQKKLVYIYMEIWNKTELFSKKYSTDFGTPDENDWIEIPCVTTNPTLKPKLYGIIDTGNWEDEETLLEESASVKFVPMTGFLVNIHEKQFDFQTYFCTLGKGKQNKIVFNRKYTTLMESNQNVTKSVFLAPDEPIHLKLRSTYPIECNSRSWIYEEPSFFTSEENNPSERFEVYPILNNSFSKPRPVLPGWQIPVPPNVTLRSISLDEYKFNYTIKRNYYPNSKYKHEINLFANMPHTSELTITCTTRNIFYDWKFQRSTIDSPYDRQTIYRIASHSHAKYLKLICPRENKMTLVPCTSHFGCIPEPCPSPFSLHSTCSFAFSLLPMTSFGIAYCRQCTTKILGVSFNYQRYAKSVHDPKALIPINTEFGILSTNKSEIYIQELSRWNEYYLYSNHSTLKLKFIVSEAFYASGLKVSFQFGSQTVLTHMDKRFSFDETFVLNNWASVDKVVCYAPLLFSEEWDEITYNIRPIRKYESPAFRDPVQNNITYIMQGEPQKQVLSCGEIYGWPKPTIVWLKNGKEIQGEQNSEYSFQNTEDQKIEYNVEYTCMASNFVDSANKTFTVSFVKPANITRLFAIIIPTFSLLVIILIILGIVYKRQHKQLRLTTAEIYQFRKGQPGILQNWNKDINSGAHYLPYNDEYEVDPENLLIDESNILGEGEFGLVKSGMLKVDNKELPVAVKCPKPHTEVNTLKILLNELKIMAFIGKHENIVSLVGACSQNIRKGDIKMALEMCDNGDLLTYLEKNKSEFLKITSNFRTLDQPSDIELKEASFKPYMGYVASIDVNVETHITQLIIWAEQIASGMDYLWSRKVIHGDLACRNVLLSGEEKIAKISDFGLSRHLFRYSIYKKRPENQLIPFKWMAIESLRDMIFTTKSDVWSYGVTLWEIFALGDSPYEEMHWSNDFLEKLENGDRLSCPKTASSEIYEKFILVCMSKNPDDRPTFETLKMKLRELLERDYNLNL